MENKPNKRKLRRLLLTAALVLLLTAALCLFRKPGAGETLFGWRYLAVMPEQRASEAAALPAESVCAVTVDRAGMLRLTLSDGETETLLKAGQLAEFKPTKKNFGWRYPAGEGRITPRSVRQACRCLFTPPGWEQLCFADLLQKRDGSVLLAVGRQDEEGLTDPHSDDSTVWWTALLIRDGKAAEFPTDAPETEPIPQTLSEAPGLSEPSDGLLRHAPSLYVSTAAKSLRLWLGTELWIYDFGGKDTGLRQGDSPAPTQLMADEPEAIPTLAASAGEPVRIVPEAGAPEPGMYRVYAYDPSQWGEISPEGTQRECAADGTFLLPDGEYLYTVIARWEEADFSGSCTYAFYCDSRSAKTGCIERMTSASAETILQVFSQTPPDAETLGEALKHAAEAGAVEAPADFEAEAEIEVYFSGGAAGFTGEDEHLHLRAGAEDALVEVYFKPRLGKPETRYFRDAALYTLILKYAQ